MPSFVSDLLERLGVGSTLEGPAVGRSLREAPSSLHDADEKADAKPKCAGQFLSKSFTNDAGTRSYKVYIPSSYHGQAMPLMVMLHGCTQDPDDFAAGTRMNIIAEEKQCLVVYPAQAHSANSAKCWNWFSAGDQKRGQGEPSIIAGITCDVIHRYKLNDQPVYVAGLSSGGAMAIIMGTTYPDLYAAVGVHSGLPYAAARDLPSALAAMKGPGRANKRHNKQKSDPSSQLKSIPIIVFHGDRDTTVNPSNGDLLMEQAVSDMRNASSDTARPITSEILVESGRIPDGHAYTCTSHHDVAGHAVAEHWVIHGAGHAWAGGSRSGTYTDPKGPDATREMMRFFYTHPQTK
jgi:poly(hydroxyalkanoate) depolymerase family esterase